ncbi:MAG: acyltransferase [Lachnospiraceae bacterium]|nr:acyltransferase [Lachnospiraceae bacterium]
MSYIEGAGGIMLGNHVAIANGVSLISTEHNYSNPSIPIKDQGIELAPIVIEDDVWIGSRAVILSGNRIRKGSIIGAGAVVTKDVEEYLICVGVPARPVKDRHSL